MCLDLVGADEVIGLLYQVLHVGQPSLNQLLVLRAHDGAAATRRRLVHLDEELVVELGRALALRLLLLILLELVVEGLELLRLFVHLVALCLTLALVATMVVAGIKGTRRVIVDQGVLVDRHFRRKPIVSVVMRLLLSHLLVHHQIRPIVLSFLRLDLV